MKKLMLILFCLLCWRSYSQPDGTFDASFGAGGIAEFTNLPAVPFSFAFVIQNDSKIVVVSRDIGPEPVIVRMNVDGTIDTTFGVDGKVILSGTSRPAGFVNSMALVIDRQQNIIAGVYGATNIFQVFAVDPSGRLLDNFQQGVVTGIPPVTQAGALDIAPTMAIADDGSIYLGLRAVTGGNTLVVKLTQNGLLDTTFNAQGTPGYVEFAGTSGSGVIALTHDGDLRVGTFVDTLLLYCVRALTPDGALDTSFGDGGTAPTPFSVGSNANGIKIQADGKILFGVGSAGSLALARLNPEGSIDVAFGVGGVAVVSAIGGLASRYWYSVRTNGTIDCVSGNSFVRLSPSGDLEQTFNSTTFDLFPTGSLQTAIDAEGNLVAVGRTTGNTLIAARFKMESLRYSALSQALWRRYYNRI